MGPSAFRLLPSRRGKKTPPLKDRKGRDQRMFIIRLTATVSSFSWFLEHHTMGNMHLHHGLLVLGSLAAQVVADSVCVSLSLLDMFSSDSILPVLLQQHQFHRSSRWHLLGMFDRNAGLHCLRPVSERGYVKQLLRFCRNRNRTSLVLQYLVWQRTLNLSLCGTTCLFERSGSSTGSASNLLGGFCHSSVDPAVLERLVHWPLLCRSVSVLVHGR